MRPCSSAVVGAERRVCSFVDRERWVAFSVGMVDFRVLISVSMARSAVGVRVSAGSCCSVGEDSRIEGDRWERERRTCKAQKTH